MFRIYSTLFACLLIFATQNLFAEDVNGIFMVVKGKVLVQSAKDPSKSEPAKVGKKVFQGDTIVAEGDSRAKVVMSDKNVLNISPDTKIQITKYENDGKDKKNVELNVVYGKLRAGVEEKYDGEKNKFNIKTPTAVAGVRGTDFLTSFNRTEKKSEIITFSGTVAVGKPGPKGEILNPVFVKPGQTTSVNDGKAPDSPKPMPAEEFNKMKTESSADTASTKQKDSKDPAKANGEDKDKDKDKKEDKKDESKKEDAKKDDKKEDVKKDEPKEDAKKDVKKDEPKKDEPKKEEGKKKDPQANNTAGGEKGDGPQRAPASSMIDSKDLGPELSKDITINNGPGNQAPPMIAPTNNYVPPPTLNNQFINDAIRRQNSKTRIIIQPNQ